MLSTTVVGTVTRDPELRFVPNGDAVASFTVAVNERKFNRDTNQYEDGEATFIRCSLWGQYAENVGDRVRKGDHVIVAGDLKQNNWVDRDGGKRSALMLNAKEVGKTERFTHRSQQF